MNVAARVEELAKRGDPIMITDETRAWLTDSPPLLRGRQHPVRLLAVNTARGIEPATR